MRAIEIITNIRSSSNGSQQSKIRPFVCPQFNFGHISESSSESDYDTLIDLNQINQVYEPPLLASIPTEELQYFEPPPYPLHTQSVERVIQVITLASQRVTTSKRRTGMAMTTMFSRSMTGNVHTKKNYKVVDVDMILNK